MIKHKLNRVLKRRAGRHIRRFWLVAKRRGYAYASHGDATGCDLKLSQCLHLMWEALDQKSERVGVRR